MCLGGVETGGLGVQMGHGVVCRTVYGSALQAGWPESGGGGSIVRKEPGVWKTVPGPSPVRKNWNGHPNCARRKHTRKEEKRDREVTVFPRLNLMKAICQEKRRKEMRELGPQECTGENGGKSCQPKGRGHPKHRRVNPKAEGEGGESYYST